MLTEKFARKPFLIDAVRVTNDNMEEVAKWCGGTIGVERRGSREVKYIQVPVSRALNERQKRAMVGDWVLYAGRSFKCYTSRAFDDCFEKPSQDAVTAIEIQGDPLPGLDNLAEKYAPGKV